MALKKKVKKETDKKRDYTAVLLEDMRDDIKLIAEGHTILEKGIRKLNEKVDKLDNKMERMEIDISVLKTDVFALKTDSLDLKSGQSQILDYLSRIEDEIQNLKKDLKENYEKKGHDKKWRELIEERLEKIEKALIQKTFSGGMVMDGK